MEVKPFLAPWKQTPIPEKKEEEESETTTSCSESVCSALERDRDEGSRCSTNMPVEAPTRMSDCLLEVHPFPRTSESDGSNKRNTLLLAGLAQDATELKERQEVQELLKKRVNFVPVYGHNSWSLTKRIPKPGFDESTLEPGDVYPTVPHSDVFFFGGVTTVDAEAQWAHGGGVSDTALHKVDDRGKIAKGYGKTQVTNLLQVLDITRGIVLHPQVIISPPARYRHAAAIHPRTNKCFLFGGAGSAPGGRNPTYYNDLWYLNHHDFSWYEPLSTGDTPPPSCGHSAAFTDDGAHFHLVGGWDAESMDLLHSWHLNVGTMTWQKVLLPSALPPRRYFEMIPLRHSETNNRRSDRITPLLATSDGDSDQALSTSCGGLLSGVPDYHKPDTYYVHHGLDSAAKEPITVKLLVPESTTEVPSRLDFNVPEASYLMAEARAKVRLLAVTQLGKTVASPPPPAAQPTVPHSHSSSPASRRHQSRVAPPASSAHEPLPAGQLWVTKRKLREAKAKLAAARRTEALGGASGVGAFLGKAKHDDAGYPESMDELEDLVGELQRETDVLSGKRGARGGATLPSTHSYACVLAPRSGVVIEFGGEDVGRGVRPVRRTKPKFGDDDELADTSGVQVQNEARAASVYLTRLHDGVSAKFENRVPVMKEADAGEASMRSGSPRGVSFFRSDYLDRSDSPTATTPRSPRSMTMGSVALVGRSVSRLENSVRSHATSHHGGTQSVGLDMTSRSLDAEPTFDQYRILPEELVRLEGLSTARLGGEGNSGLVVISGGRDKADGTLSARIWILDTEALVAACEAAREAPAPPAARSEEATDCPKDFFQAPQAGKIPKGSKASTQLKSAEDGASGFLADTTTTQLRSAQMDDVMAKYKEFLQPPKKKQSNAKDKPQVARRTAGASCLKGKDTFARGAIVRRVLELGQEANPPTPTLPFLDHQKQIEEAEAEAKRKSFEEATAESRAVADYEEQTKHIDLHDRYAKVKEELAPYGLDQVTAVSVQTLACETIKTCAPGRTRALARAHQWYRQPVVTQGIQDQATARVTKPQSPDHPAETATQHLTRVVKAELRARRVSEQIDSAKDSALLKVLASDAKQQETEQRNVSTGGGLKRRKLNLAGVPEREDNHIFDDRAQSSSPIQGREEETHAPSTARFELVFDRRTTVAEYNRRRIETKIALGAKAKGDSSKVTKVVGPPPQAAVDFAKSASVVKKAAEGNRRFRPRPPLVSPRSVMNVAAGVSADPTFNARKIEKKKVKSIRGHSNLGKRPAKPPRQN